MPSLASDILNLAKETLNDPDAIHWSDNELLGYLNEAQQQTALLRPEANSVTVQIALTAGTSRQSIPDDAYSLIDVIRNVGGKAIRFASKYHLGKNVPDWHEASGTEVRDWVYDIRNRRTFYVHPAPTTAVMVEIVVSQSPADLAAASDTLTLDTVYNGALRNYVMSQALAKDIALEDAALNKANAYYQAFLMAIGARTESDVRQHPGAGVQSALTERGH